MSREEPTPHSHKDQTFPIGELGLPPLPPFLGVVFKGTNMETHPNQLLPDVQPILGQIHLGLDWVQSEEARALGGGGGGRGEGGGLTGPYTV